MDACPGENDGLRWLLNLGHVSDPTAALTAPRWGNGRALAVSGSLALWESSLRVRHRRKRQDSGEGPAPEDPGNWTMRDDWPPGVAGV